MTMANRNQFWAPRIAKGNQPIGRVPKLPLRTFPFWTHDSFLPTKRPKTERRAGFCKGWLNENRKSNLGLAQIRRICGSGQYLLSVDLAEDFAHFLPSPSALNKSDDGTREALNLADESLALGSMLIRRLRSNPTRVFEGLPRKTRCSNLNLAGSKWTPDLNPQCVVGHHCKGSHYHLSYWSKD